MNFRNLRIALLGIGLLVPVAVTSASCAAIVGIEDWEGGDGGAGATSSSQTTVASTSTGNPDDFRDLCRANCQGGCIRCKADLVCRSACSDGLSSLDEPTADCGGPYCKRCPAGAKCNDPSDCQSNQCTNSGTCASGNAPVCND